MPGKDGTGQGPVGGGKAGIGGMGGRGQMGGKMAAGPVGICVCSQCGEKVSHQ